MKVTKFISLTILALVVTFSILATQTSAIAQTPALVIQTGQIESYAFGDDGDLQKGVQWPDPRFTDNGDGTVTDNLTGLIWLKNADCFGDKNWYDALAVSNNLVDGQCGLTDGSSPGDWRLPNVREILSLINHGNPSPVLPSGHPFTNVRSTGGEPSSYWSSTTVENRTDAACYVLMDPEGHLMDDAPKNPGFSYVWPVRDGFTKRVKVKGLSWLMLLLDDDIDDTSSDFKCGGCLGYQEQPSYTGSKPSDWVIVVYEDFYKLLIHDAVAGWRHETNTCNSNEISVAIGFQAEYFHILNTNCVKISNY